MKYESFSFDTDDYARELTAQSHQTLHWLHRHGYIDGEQTEELLSRMVVVPIRNNPKFGQRLLDRFFRKGDDSTKDSFTFPITLIDDDRRASDVPKKGKPKLEVVKDD